MRSDIESGHIGCSMKSRVITNLLQIPPQGRKEPGKFKKFALLLKQLLLIRSGHFGSGIDARLALHSFICELSFVRLPDLTD